jgi:hypothetical protein
MINFIVIATTAVSVGFVVFWSVWPAFRKSAERPKYTVLENDRRFRRIVPGVNATTQSDNPQRMSNH